MKKELIFEVNVKCEEAVSLKGHTKDIVMIPFKGSVESPLFTGRVIGVGTDTQKITKSGDCRLSARYMLEGTEADGKKCRIFIENETRDDGTLRPVIVTDSEALACLETAELLSEVEPSDGGVTVKIYREVS